MPPGRTPLRNRLIGAMMVLVLGGLGGACAWLVAESLRTGVVDARHGTVLRSAAPVWFAVEIAIRSAAALVLVAMAVWLAWFTAFPPADRPARRRRRAPPRR